MHSLLPKGVKLLPEDVFARVSFVLSAKVLDPQFQGQIKERLNSREDGQTMADYGVVLAVITIAVGDWCAGVTTTARAPLAASAAEAPGRVVTGMPASTTARTTRLRSTVSTIFMRRDPSGGGLHGGQARDGVAALEKCGFVREGILRQHAREMAESIGANAELVGFGRSEPPRLSNGFSALLRKKPGKRIPPARPSRNAGSFATSAAASAGMPEPSCGLNCGPQS